VRGIAAACKHHLPEHLQILAEKTVRMRIFRRWTQSRQLSAAYFTNRSPSGYDDIVVIQLTLEDTAEVGERMQTAILRRQSLPSRPQTEI
jgi:hypothetical protein